MKSGVFPSLNRYKYLIPHLLNFAASFPTSVISILAGELEESQVMECNWAEFVKQIYNRIYCPDVSGYMGSQKTKFTHMYL